MARISRDEYPAIQHLVDVQGRKVAEVAVTYGCTPANIYAILGKTRRSPTAPDAPAKLSSTPAQDSTGEAMSKAAPAVAATGATEPLAADLFADLPDGAAPAQARPAGTDDGAASDEQVASTAPAPVTAAPIPDTKPQGRLAPPSPPAPATAGSEPTVRATPAAQRAARAGANRSKKAGVALLMRTSDGEETVHPFRSLEELLAASKPLLRSAARSPEPIWFSIQEADFDVLSDDDF